MSAVPAHPADLEPSLVAFRTYVTRRRYGYIDSTSVLTIQVCLLMLFPAAMIIPPFTYIGRPAMLMGIGLFVWWILVRLNSRLVMTGPQPMRWAVFFIVISVTASYAAGFLRGLPPLEANGADLAMLAIMEFIGVILIAADGIANWERLNGVLRVFTSCAGFMAVIGVLQFVLKRDVSRYLLIPGLQLKGALPGLEDRGGGGLFRVASTTNHYIEFSCVMAIALPFAIHYARFAETRRQRQVYAVIAALTASAIPVTLSRTGIVALAAAMIVMLPAWNWRIRYNMLVATVGLLSAFMVLRPGLLGTVKSLFSGLNSDPSIEGRTEDYSVVFHYFSERPWLGRGSGTFIPKLYQTLDNEWLSMLVTNGIIGVAALAGVHLTAIALAWIALRRSTRAADRHLCAALISTQLIAILAAGTFDSLGFSTYAIILMLLTGATGAVWRFTHPNRVVRTSTVHRNA